MAMFDIRSATISVPSKSQAPSDVLRLATPDNTHQFLSENMDAYDGDLNFPGEDLLDEVNQSSLPLPPFTPSFDFEAFDAFSTTFEDPFHQVGVDFSPPLEENDPQQSKEPASSSAEQDNKLLGFGATTYHVTILDDAGQAWPTMTAELYGMFCVAEDVFGPNTTTTGRPTELTCYRRNLFQISGSIMLSRKITGILDEQGQQTPLRDLTVTLSAKESIDQRNTEIISVPWKGASAGATADEKAGTLPVAIPLNLSASQEGEASLVTIPLAWKRLQFKHATANNGRRKGLQQHYTIQITLTATLPTKDTVKLAEIQSGPIIVRGRSPRNFDGRKDVPLHERKVESKQRKQSDSSATPVPLKVDPGVTNGAYRFYALDALSQPLDLTDWVNTPISTPVPEFSPRPTKRPAISYQSSSSSNQIRPPIPQARWNSDSFTTRLPPATAPIDLSFLEDDYGKAGSFAGHRRSGSAPNTGIGRDKVSARRVGSPVEDADLLYEYFPLSLDDWMPPVDAIYRPHVVHHTHPELEAVNMKKKAKRYFSAND